MKAPTASVFRAYATAPQVAAYLGAPSARTGRRWILDLRASGLRQFRVAGAVLYKLAEVDAAMERQAEVSK